MWAAEIEKNTLPGWFTSKNVTAKWYRYRGPNLGTGQSVENTHAASMAAKTRSSVWEFSGRGDTYLEGRGICWVDAPRARPSEGPHLSESAYTKP
jgi:hypothetical protein